MNRIRMEYRASLSSAERELEQVRVGIRKVIEEGFAGPALKKDMDELQARKGRLKRTAWSPVPDDISLQVAVVAGAGFEPATFGL